MSVWIEQKPFHNLQQGQLAREQMVEENLSAWTKKESPAPQEQLPNIRHEVIVITDPQEWEDLKRALIEQHLQQTLGDIQPPPLVDSAESSLDDIDDKVVDLTAERAARRSGTLSLKERTARGVAAALVIGGLFGVIHSNGVNNTNSVSAAEHQLALNYPPKCDPLDQIPWPTLNFTGSDGSSWGWTMDNAQPDLKKNGEKPTFTTFPKKNGASQPSFQISTEDNFMPAEAKINRDQVVAGGGALVGQPGSTNQPGLILSAFDQVTNLAIWNPAPVQINNVENPYNSFTLKMNGLPTGIEENNPYACAAIDSTAGKVYLGIQNTGPGIRYFEANWDPNLGITSERWTEVTNNPTSTPTLTPTQVIVTRTPTPTPTGTVVFRYFIYLPAVTNNTSGGR